MNTNSNDNSNSIYEFDIDSILLEFKNLKEEPESENPVFEPSQPIKDISDPEDDVFTFAFQDGRSTHDEKGFSVSLNEPASASKRDDEVPLDIDAEFAFDPEEIRKEFESDDEDSFKDSIDPAAVRAEFEIEGTVSKFSPKRSKAAPGPEAKAALAPKAAGHSSDDLIDSIINEFRTSQKSVELPPDEPDEELKPEDEQVGSPGEGFQVDIMSEPTRYRRYAEPEPEPEPKPAPVLPPSGGIVITDDNFEAYLLSLCDANGDKAISTAEAQSVKSMDFCTDNIIYLDGIQYFTNLNSLSARGSVWKGRLTCEDFSKNTSLSYLDCSFNQIEDMNLPSGLETLICRFNKLETLKLQGSGKLRKLDCYGNYLDTIDLSKCTSLEEFTCGLNNFTTLDLSCNLKLNYLDLSDCNNLKTVYLSRGQRIKTIIADNSIDFKYKD